MKSYNKFRIIPAVMAVVLLCSCRGEEPDGSGGRQIGSEDSGDICGLFVLNEGNMGSNLATLDHYSYDTGYYATNIFGKLNPDVVKELGDVGNDLQIYGERLYAVINLSNYIEIMDVNTLRHLGKVSIPNCRYITFKDQYAYVSSYAGAVQLDTESRIGYVAKIDTLSMEIVGECNVGYQPEQMAIAGNKLYVANSGGYRAPYYDTTVSVIDLDKFEVVNTIEVGINLHRMQLDNYGNLWVSSRGDYYGKHSCTYVIDTKTDTVTDTLELLPCSSMALYGDKLYVISNEHNKSTGEDTVSYAVVDTKTKTIVSRKFINDGTEKQIRIPYGIAVNPVTGDIFITDAKDYLMPGNLLCYGNDGVLKWAQLTGNIPAQIVFTRKKLIPLEEE